MLRELLLTLEVLAATQLAEEKLLLSFACDVWRQFGSVVFKIQLMNTRINYTSLTQYVTLQ
jgi:hypothetical protein